MGASSVRRLAPAVLILAPVLLVALVVPLLPLADPVRQDIAGRLAGSSAAHWLGQDEYGRDVLSRLLWGARVSLSIALAASLAAAVAGTLLGLLGGYFRGLVEFATVRVAEVVLCFPPLLLALLVVTLLGPGSLTLIVSLAILFAPNFARVAYAETLSARALDYVTAQVSLGAGAPRILALTVLPNVAAPLIVQVSLTVAAALLLESGLSFLGLGVVPPAPSWGLMIRGARTTMEQAPLLLVWPCLALTLTVLLLNQFCDRLRDVLDPRARALGPPAFLRRKPVLADPAPVRDAAGGLLAVRGLTLEAPGPRGPVAVVRGIDLALAHGETLAVVGESGSGKTLTGLAVMGLLPPGIRVASGEIAFAGASGPAADLLRLPERRLRALRGGSLSMVFQDPASSLNPLLRVGTQVGEALRAHGARGVRARVVALLDRVELPDPARRARSYAHELSGGQRQRVMIASAVANHPRLLIADEPTTALDVTVQAQILALMADLKRVEPDMGLIFITHNLPVVAAIADRVAVMYAGEVVEQGAVAEVFARPRHPYTAALIASTPESAQGRLAAIVGTVPPPWADLPGCRFAPRCAHAAARCEEAAPRLEPAGAGRSTRCLRWTEIA